MTEKCKCLKLIAALALAAGFLLGCRENRDAERPTHFSDDVARSMVVEHYKKVEHESIVPSSMTVLPVGDDFRVVLVPVNGLQPASRQAWVAGIGKYALQPLDSNSLKTAFLNSYPPSNNDEERREAAGLFVELLSHQGLRPVFAGPAKVIESLNQIPGYEKSPLDPDIASTVRPPYNPSDNELVLFTYEQAGGIVCRYKFVFRQDGRLFGASRLKLDEKVGAAHFYQ